MTESIFASKAEIGKRYLTKGGSVVTVLAPTLKGGVVVRDELRGVSLPIYGDQLLYPYDRSKINKEAIAMANAEKKSTGKGERKPYGSDRGAKRTGEGILLFRRIGNVTHEVLSHGGVLTYRTKDYMTLKDVAEEIRGKKISGSGRSFFGLRSEPNITLGKEIIKALGDAEDERKAAERKEAEKAAHKSFPKPGKGKKAKMGKDEEDEEEPVKSKAGGVAAEPAGVHARGRGR